MSWDDSKVVHWAGLRVACWAEKKAVPKVEL